MIGKNKRRWARNSTVTRLSPSILRERMRGKRERDFPTDSMQYPSHGGSAVGVSPRVG